MHFIREAEYSSADCRFDFQLLAGTPGLKTLNIIYTHSYGEEEFTAVSFGSNSYRTECTSGDDLYPDTMIDMDPLDFQALISAASGEEKMGMLKDLFWMNGSAEDEAAEEFLSRYAGYLSEIIPEDNISMDAHMLYAFTDMLLDPDDILMNVFCQETWQAVHTAARNAETQQELFERLRALDELRMYDDDSIHGIAVFCTECDYTPDERVEVHFTTQEDKLKMRILWR